jgi:hypothetical protein
VVRTSWRLAFLLLNGNLLGELGLISLFLGIGKEKSASVSYFLLFLGYCWLKP